MAYMGKTNWQLNEIVKPEDMNRIEQGIFTLEAEKIASGSISVGSGTANYTPAGTLTGGAIGVTLSTSTKYVAESATGGGSVTTGTAASCTLPSLSMSVSDETLSLSWSAGSFTPNRPTAVTLPSFKQATVASGVSSASITTQPTFKGTGVELKFTGKP